MRAYCKCVRRVLRSCLWHVCDGRSPSLRDKGNKLRGLETQKWGSVYLLSKKALDPYHLTGVYKKSWTE